MNEQALKHTDRDDIVDVIELAERSFTADLSPAYSMQINTLGEFIDLINQYTPGGPATDCTTQQAFYRIRSSLAITSGVDLSAIRPETTLTTLIPSPNRRQTVRKLDHDLGVATELLVPKQWLVTSLACLLLLSLAIVGPAWPYGLTGLFLYGVGAWLTYKTAGTLAITTVGQLAQKLSREHYRTIRRNAATVNRNELASLIFDLFSHKLGIPRHLLTRDTLLWPQVVCLILLSFVA